MVYDHQNSLKMILLVKKSVPFILTKLYNATFASVCNKSHIPVAADQGESWKITQNSSH